MKTQVVYVVLPALVATAILWQAWVGLTGPRPDSIPPALATPNSLPGTRTPTERELHTILAAARIDSTKRELPRSKQPTTVSVTPDERWVYLAFAPDVAGKDGRRYLLYRENAWDDWELTSAYDPYVRLRACGPGLAVPEELVGALKRDGVRCARRSSK